MNKTADIIRKGNGSLDADAYKNLVGHIDIDGLTIEVVVMDARLAYGRLDFSVTPKSGNGTKWVSALKVTLTGDRTLLTPMSGEARTTATTGLGFRGEVARRKALQMKKDAEQAFVNNKSILDLLITQKEETNE
jgi:hypothetical protein